jgi:hypothetical protein
VGRGIGFKGIRLGVSVDNPWPHRDFQLLSMAVTYRVKSKGLGFQFVINGCHL